ncbi:MAG: GNAT family N-acetyltransferase [Acidobacteria bacterium]|nr:GNAT family N-acetyltransferase [Acidobacteriota bacterium]
MTSSQFILREYTQADHEHTFRWLQQIELRRYLGTRSAPTEASHVDWFARMRSRTDVRLFAVDFKTIHVGNLYLVDVDTGDSRAEVQLFIGEAKLRGQGIGTCTLRLIQEEAFKKMNLHRLYAYVFDFNHRALKCFLESGFVREGFLRDHRHTENGFVGVHILGRLRHDG